MNTKDIKANGTTIDGLTLEEHLELGRAFATILESLESMTECGSVPDGRKKGYERMSVEVDAILDECADYFRDSYHDTTGEWCDDSIYPYPRFFVVGDAILMLVPMDECDMPS